MVTAVTAERSVYVRKDFSGINPKATVCDQDYGRRGGGMFRSSFFSIGSKPLAQVVLPLFPSSIEPRGVFPFRDVHRHACNC